MCALAGESLSRSQRALADVLTVVEGAPAGGELGRGLQQRRAGHEAEVRAGDLEQVGDADLSGGAQCSR